MNGEPLAYYFMNYLYVIEHVYVPSISGDGDSETATPGLARKLSQFTLMSVAMVTQKMHLFRAHMDKKG